MLGNRISNGLNSVGHVKLGGHNFYSKKFAVTNSKSNVKTTTSCAGDGGRNHIHISNEFSYETATYLQLLGENSSDGAYSRQKIPVFVNMLLFISSIRKNLKTRLKMLRSSENKQ